jgi:hypothetical protein
MMRLIVVSTAVGLALGMIAFAAPSSASPRAAWTTRVFQVSYDGSGDVSYHAEGPVGDSGCYLAVNGTDSYSFGQLWTMKIGFRRTGPGAYATKVESITHVDGPQGATGAEAKSGLGGDKTVAPNAQTCTNANSNDTGHFSCTSKKLLMLAVANPQMKLVRNGTNLLAESVAFADGFWTYSGSDTIPSDKLNGGCAVYSDTDLTFGAGIFAGSDSITKVALAVKALAGLAKHGEITAPVHFGKNTLHPKQTTCATSFAKPDKCVIRSQALNAKLKLLRIK